MDKLTLRELIRYGYTGMLCAIVAAVVDRMQTKQLVEDLGPILSPLAVLAVGAVAYVVFKTLLGDLILTPLTERGHSCRRNTRCKRRFLQKTYKVEASRAEAAYRLLRDSLVKKNQRERFHSQHSEGYLLFVTASVCGSVFLLARFGWLPTEISVAKSATFGVLAVVTLAAGIRQDIVICEDERAAIGTLNRQEVKDTLRAGGFM